MSGLSEARDKCLTSLEAMDKCPKVAAQTKCSTGLKAMDKCFTGLEEAMDKRHMSLRTWTNVSWTLSEAADICLTALEALDKCLVSAEVSSIL